MEADKVMYFELGDFLNKINCKSVVSQRSCVMGVHSFRPVSLHTVLIRCNDTK